MDIIKKNMKKNCVILFLFLLGQGISIAQNNRGIAFYNVENLFDTIDGSNDDAEFLPEGKNNWNSQKYFEKLQHIRQVLNSMGKPLVVGFSEIENASVVREIIKTDDFSSYGLVHFESPDARGIDVALIYDSTKLKLLQSGNIRFILPGETKATTRDIIWAQYQHKKTSFYVMVNHWPSRRGGADDSEIKRLKAAEIGAHFIDSLLQKDPKTKIVFLGDLNDHPTDKAPQIIEKLLTPLITPKSGAFGGSYNYNNEWGVLDHIYVSKGMLEGHFKTNISAGSIHSFPYLIEEYKGNKVPFRTYGGTKYLGGYSDHFPVSISIYK